MKQGLFQLHVPGTNRATPVRFCSQVRLHIHSLRDQAPHLEVWAASVGGDTETGARLPGERPPNVSPGLSWPRKEARAEEGGAPSTPHLQGVHIPGFDPL